MSAGGGGARIGAAAARRGSAPQKADDLLRQRPVAREQDDPRGRRERVALLAGEQLPAQDEHVAHRVLRGAPDSRGARADQRLEREPSSGE